MQKRIIGSILGIVLLGQILASPLFAQEKKKKSPIDFNVQVGGTTSLNSGTLLAENMEKLGAATAELKATKDPNGDGTGAGTVSREQVIATVDAYNGAAQAINDSLASSRLGISFQFGLKPINTGVVLAVGLESGIRFGGVTNVSSAEEFMLLFDIPLRLYVGLEFFKIIRADASLGFVFSGSSIALSDFTTNPGKIARDAGVKAKELFHQSYLSPQFDLNLRATVFAFYLELNGTINLDVPEDLSILRVGAGVNLSIL